MNAAIILIILGIIIKTVIIYCKTKNRKNPNRLGFFRFLYYETKRSPFEYLQKNSSHIGLKSFISFCRLSACCPCVLRADN